MKIVDFGLAKANSQLEKSEPGIIKGKFSYLSPEAAMGQEVDARTDIFAVGIILWELLAGQRLFLGDTDFQTVKKVQAAQVPSISQINKKVPAGARADHHPRARARSRRSATRRRATLGPGPVEVHVQVRRAGEHVRHRDARPGRDEGAAAAPPACRRASSTSSSKRRSSSSRRSPTTRATERRRRQADQARRRCVEGRPAARGRRLRGRRVVDRRDRRRLEAGR